MTRVDHLYHALSLRQITFLCDLVDRRYNDLNNLTSMTDDEKYARELLHKALGDWDNVTKA